MKDLSGYYLKNIYDELKAIQSGLLPAPTDSDLIGALETIRLYCLTHDCEMEKDCKLENLCMLSIADIEKVICEIRRRW